MKKGFTLIEVLIVVAIMAAVTTGSVTLLHSSLQASRDTQRKNDLKQYKIALENYATDNNNLYPNFRTGYASGGMCANLLNGKYIQSCIDDPKINKPSYAYYYQSSLDKTRWVLWARLERKTNTAWVYCSNGKSGENPQLVTDLSMGLTDANCPLQ